MAGRRLARQAFQTLQYAASETCSACSGSTIARSAVAAGPSAPRRSASTRRAMHSSARTRLEIAPEENNTKTAQAEPVPSSSSSSSSASLGISKSFPGRGSLPVETGEEAQQQQRSGLPSFSFANPPQLPLTPSSHLVARVTFSSYAMHRENLDFYVKFVSHAAYAFGLPCSRAAPLPTKTSLRTVPRSPFVHKPSQENFVKKEHARSVKIYDGDLQRVQDFLQYITENGMDGIRIKANLFERKEVGYGKKMVNPEEGVAELAGSTEDQVKKMAQELLDSGFGGEEQPETQTTPKGTAGKER